MVCRYAQITSKVVVLDEYKELIRSFVRSCLPPRWEELDSIGFAEKPGGEMLSCSTYYALRILERIDEKPWIEQHKGKLESFFRSCWATGGFKASPKTPRTLIHTCLAVAALNDILGRPQFLQDKKRSTELLSYILSCKDRNGGYQLWSSTFGLGGRWYAANLYATYHVLQAVRLLAADLPAFVGLLDEEEIRAFILGNAVEEEGFCVWRGYSIGRTKVEKAVAAWWRKPLDALLMPRDRA